MVQNNISSLTENEARNQELRLGEESAKRAENLQYITSSHNQASPFELITDKKDNPIERQSVESNMEKEWEPESWPRNQHSRKSIFKSSAAISTALSRRKGKWTCERIGSVEKGWRDCSTTTKFHKCSSGRIQRKRGKPRRNTREPGQQEEETIAMTKPKRVIKKPEGTDIDEIANWLTD